MQTVRSVVASEVGGILETPPRHDVVAREADVALVGNPVGVAVLGETGGDRGGIAHAVAIAVG